jgi:hypothetical protein
MESYTPIIINYDNYKDIPKEDRDKLDEYFVKCKIEKRREELNITDKYMLVDYPIDAEKLEIVKDYRQKLRDFTKNGYILPNKPEFIKDN